MVAHKDSPGIYPEDPAQTSDDHPGPLEPAAQIHTKEHVLLSTDNLLPLYSLLAWVGIPNSPTFGIERCCKAAPAVLSHFGHSSPYLPPSAF